MHLILCGLACHIIVHVILINLGQHKTLVELNVIRFGNLLEIC